MDLQDYENRVGLTIIAKAMLAGRSDWSMVGPMAAAMRAPDRAQRVLKAAIAPAVMSDPAWAGNLADWRVLASGFFESLRTRSVFFRLLDERAFARVPLRTRIAAMTAGATGYIVGEGQLLPLSKLQLASNVLQPIRAAALVVVSDEVANDLSNAAQQLVSRELRGAVADTVDGEFLARAVDTSTLISAASGVTAASAKADLRDMLLSVNTAAAGRLVWVAAPDVANKASTLATTSGADAFPNVSPTGGELFNLPFLVSSAVPSGRLYLVDASGIAADADTITLDTSHQALVEMDSSPAGGAGAVQTSLWQANLTGLLAAVFFGVEGVRDNAAAALTDIDWGAAA